MAKKTRAVFHYRPEGMDPQSWDFAPLQMKNAEAEEIEDVTGRTFLEWQERFLAGCVKSNRALLYVLLKRDRPSLKFDQVAFSMGEIETEFITEDDGADPEPEAPKDQAPKAAKAKK